MGKSKGISGNWLVTYSDLVTLLLVFFVLLYLMTPGVDEATFNNFITYFQKSIGIMEKTSIVNESAADRNTLRQEWERIRSSIEEQGLSSEVEIERIPDGIKVTLSDALTFDSGSAELLPEAKRVLGEMAGIMDDKVSEIKVQGHTDNVPIARTSSYQSNWHLGAARAVSVVLFMKDRTGLDPGNFEASSFGEYKPVATNITADGRRQNRRVEMYVQYKDASRPIGQMHRLHEAEPQSRN